MWACSYILDSLNEHKRTTSLSGTLVLVAVDGNRNMECSTRVLRLAEQAAGYGWTVHIWLWKAAMSNVFREFAERYKDLVLLHELDHYRPDITFIRHDGVDVQKECWMS